MGGKWSCSLLTNLQPCRDRSVALVARRERESVGRSASRICPRWELGWRPPAGGGALNLGQTLGPIRVLRISVLLELSVPNDEDLEVSLNNLNTTNPLTGSRFGLLWRSFPCPQGLARGTLFFLVVVSIARSRSNCSQETAPRSNGS